MKANRDDNVPRRGLTFGQVSLILFGLVAPFLTFLLAVSSLAESVKIFVLIILAAGYSVICFWSFRQSQREGVAPEIASSPFRNDPVDSLHSIGEASEFFGASLKPPDLFRLISNRVAQIFPFSNSALFVPNETGDTLEIVQADGLNAPSLLELQVPVDRGLAGMAWLSHEVETDHDLRLETAAMSAQSIENMRSAVAIPLLHEQRPFGVLTLYREEPLLLNDDVNSILHLIGERVAPLFLSSISLERSISNALTDSLTNLPNERAFFLVLENQLAESQRLRGERPLTVVSIDIKNFADANQNFGFAAGDKLLAFTAEHLTSQLRKMDFLARSANDEFLIILPTASEKFGAEIIQRIKDKFATAVFAVSESEETKVWLNFGSATFWQDGETAEQLLQTARIRKQQSKAEEPAKVLWFPKEYVN